MISTLKYPNIPTSIIGSALGFLVICLIMLHGFNVALLFPVILGIFLLMTYVFQIISGDKILGSFLSLALLVSFSWIKSPWNILFFYITQIFFVGYLIVNKDTAKDLFYKDIQSFLNISKWDAVVVFILILHVMTLGWLYHHRFYMLDTFHPTYELSIGRTYALSMIPAPNDLSYLGKVITHHFLSTSLPIFFSDVFRIHILSSLYFVVPGVLTFIYVYLIYYFFQSYPHLKASLSLIFFLPIMAAGGFSFETSYERFFQAPSFALAAILVLYLICFIERERFGFLVLASVMLLFTKAPFFIVIGGGMALYLLRLKKNPQFIIYNITLGIIFLIAWVLFFSHVKGYYHWVTYPYVLFCKSWFAKIVLLYFVIALVSFFKRGKPKINYLLSSLALVGIGVGTLILREGQGDNNLQFLTAATIPIILIFNQWMLDYMEKESLSKIKFFQFIYKRFLPLLFIFCFVGITISQYKTVIRYTIKIVSERFMGADILAERVKKSPYRKKIMVPSVSNNFIEAYVWLKNNTSPKSIFLFGKHYESIWQILPWRDDTGNMRTALSARQMYYEGLWYKGIYIENDVWIRFAKSLYIYKYFVISSDDHTDKLDSLLSKGKYWQDVRNEFAKFPPDDIVWVKDFIRQNKIDYLILEGGDLPANQLKNMMDEVYSNDEVRIFKFKTNFEETGIERFKLF